MDKKLHDVPDWIEDILNHVVENYNERKVVLWGKHDTSEYIADLLRDVYAIETECYIDNDYAKVDNHCVYSKEHILGKVQEYYIVVPLGYYHSIVEILTRGGIFPAEITTIFVIALFLKQKIIMKTLMGIKFMEIIQG